MVLATVIFLFQMSGRPRVWNKIKQKGCYCVILHSSCSPLGTPYSLSATPGEWQTSDGGDSLKWNLYESATVPEKMGKGRLAYFYQHVARLFLFRKNVPLFPMLRRLATTSRQMRAQSNSFGRNLRQRCDESNHGILQFVNYTIPAPTYRNIPTGCPFADFEIKG